MIIKQYIKDFEKLGFGMFVHFGLYSVHGCGEWHKHDNDVPYEVYNTALAEFNPKSDWAADLVRLAKNAGCKYITLTSRHHDGFSLYDTCGLSDYDSVHSKCGRDLVREFVDACNAEGILPFFYHTLLDWWNEDYVNDFPTYLNYLRDSVKLLCTNYGNIGGIWFDGMWNKPDADWEEDALFSMIRSYQPEAMIINNTGLDDRGALGHIELDSVTFERGKPQPINLENSPKYIASEMCEIFCDHWGYAREDLAYKSPASIIEELADCRRYHANFLLNVGPMADGSVREIDRAMLNLVGTWVSYYDEAIREPEPTDIAIEGKPQDFILKHENNYYLFCYNLQMRGNAHVAIWTGSNYDSHFKLPEQIVSMRWMDNEEDIDFEQNGEQVLVHTKPFPTGRNLVVRVAKIICK